MSHDPENTLRAGVAELDPVLEPAGFVFDLTGRGQGLEISYAVGRYTRGAQYLELHFRYTLSLVAYGWADVTVSHSHYLAVLGEEGQYPGEAEDPLDAFRRLALDLRGPVAGFVAGDAELFERIATTSPTPRPRPTS